jgi:aspartate carbamoyltransferase regulatory subunit
VFFECQSSNDSKGSIYVSCLRCIVKNSDYSGRFKCPNPNCLQHKKETILKKEITNAILAKLRTDYLEMVHSQSKSNTNLLKKKSTELLESLKGFFYDFE